MFFCRVDEHPAGIKYLTGGDYVYGFSSEVAE